MSLNTFTSETDNQADTRWSIVRRAGSECATLARPAIALLYKRYLPSVYAWSRTNCATIEDAEDLSHSFFEHLIKTNWFAQAHPSRGRLRTFLMSTLRNHAINVWRRSNAKVRKAGKNPLPLDMVEVIAEVEASTEAERRLASPDHAFQREWARVMLRETMERLESAYVKQGKDQLFQVLSPWIADSAGNNLESGGSTDYREAAAALQMNQGAVRMAVSRLKEDYRAVLWKRVGEEIGSSDREAIREELRCLAEAC